MEYPKSDYKEYPKTLPPDDFWGQVRRTIHGRPVSESQIDLIVQAIDSGLALSPDDHVLDVACGNGALTSRLESRCASLHGVDNSDYLIQVAVENFANPGRVTFDCKDAVAWVLAEPHPERFTKVLCYGSLQYFPAQAAHDLLATLARRFPRVRRLLIGNTPDREKAHLFFSSGTDCSAELDNHAAAVGKWRSHDEMRRLAETTGWRVSFQQMPSEFLWAHYRYDAILEPIA